LPGAFCAACGQRSVPPNPTVRELAGDAWQELSGYDGRIMATVRGLLRPGFLTLEYLAGRRAHYLPPLRVYLIVSVAYFLVAAAAPNAGGTADGPGGMRIAVDDRSGEQLTAEEREKVLADLEEAPWYLRSTLRPALEDPAGFRQRMFTVMPRVFFAMLPAFAAIVALFYRGRSFPTAMVFAVHLHACAFVLFAVSEAAKFTRSPAVTATVGGIMAIGFAVYALRALRTVFGGRWPMTLAKAAAIGLVYSIVSVPAFIVIVFWASWT
jgi:hypothetical protein